VSAPKEPRWLTRAIVEAVHTDQIRQHGGSFGVRDGALLESALARPRNRWHYEPEVDVSELGAAYAYGIAKNHPFIDGNKRAAFQDGWRIRASEDDVRVSPQGASMKLAWPIGCGSARSGGGVGEPEPHRATQVRTLLQITRWVSRCAAFGRWPGRLCKW
jgi:death-on-curing family protein